MGYTERAEAASVRLTAVGHLALPAATAADQCWHVAEHAVAAVAVVRDAGALVGDEAAPAVPAVHVVHGVGDGGRGRAAAADARRRVSRPPAVHARPLVTPDQPVAAAAGVAHRGAHARRQVTHRRELHRLDGRARLQGVLLAARRRRRRPDAVDAVGDRPRRRRQAVAGLAAVVQAAAVWDAAAGGGIHTVHQHVGRQRHQVTRLGWNRQRHSIHASPYDVVDWS